MTDIISSWNASKKNYESKENKDVVKINVERLTKGGLPSS